MLLLKIIGWIVAVFILLFVIEEFALRIRTGYYREDEPVKTNWDHIPKSEPQVWRAGHMLYDPCLYHREDHSWWEEHVHCKRPGWDD